MNKKIKGLIKPIIKPIAYILLLSFAAVYIISLTGYYKTVENQNSTLTTEAINRFEKDVLNGEKIVASNYLEEKKDYNNLISRAFIKLGNIIDNIFNKIMHYIMREIESAIN